MLQHHQQHHQRNHLLNQQQNEESESNVGDQGFQLPSSEEVEREAIKVCVRIRPINSKEKKVSCSAGLINT